VVKFYNDSVVPAVTFACLISDEFLVKYILYPCCIFMMIYLSTNQTVVVNSACVQA